MATTCRSRAVRTLRSIGVHLYLMLALMLGGCSGGSTSTSDEMADRFYRYGQNLGWFAVSKGGTIEEAVMVAGFYLIADDSPEATLLLSMYMLSNDENRTGQLEKVDEGARNPKDTSKELFLDPLPAAEKEEADKFVQKYTGRSFVEPAAKRQIESKLRSSSFAVRALYVRYLIARYAGGHETQRTVIAELERQANLETNEREKKFWNLLTAVVNNHDPFRGKPKLTDRELCRGNLETIANGEMAYRVKNETEFTADLSKLVKVMERDLPECPEKGTYSVTVDVPKHSFTVHCSVSAHDAGEAGKPAGYSPGINGE
ncbi:MAG: hypothetical protein ABIV13_04240 [Fimbriimonadales bacterium]